MIKLIETVKYYIDGKYFDFITNRVFNATNNKINTIVDYDTTKLADYDIIPMSKFVANIDSAKNTK